ncbi:hypothetical protein OU995_16845 [Roseateles sp. SL47]|uniref:hypothetical protein n=1 Tax=Roseateles sp. SL47 TaxID=2995138 RepID=UPI00226FD117|nr:hypothetical protein [Roseateles sp. SL47]WAC71253.1 hypothetical protein OU995_16845 [Roseateles sp. SL47]
MATSFATLTPTANTAPTAVNIPARELSGAQWVARFPGSNAISDCIQPFAGNLQSFVNAMRDAGATVTISATYRPPERAYLMHWCYLIVKEDFDPRNVPPMAGINIRWDHSATDGSYDGSASVNAAKAMVNGFGLQNLQTPPALNTRHTARNAVDMTISWSDDLTIKKADGTAVTISTTPKTGMNADLKAVGASYNVMKFVGGASDKPHWSDDGH